MPCIHMEDRSYSSTILDLGDECEWSALRFGRSIPGEKAPKYPLRRRLDVPQSRSWRCGEKKNLLPLVENRSLAIQSVALHYTDWIGSSTYCYAFRYLTWLWHMEFVHYECPMTGDWKCRASIAVGYAPLKAFCFLFVCANENQCLSLTDKYLRCLALRFLRCRRNS
jgi:hypothetical protein